MEAEAYLEQVRGLDEKIKAKIAEREQLIALATDVSSKPNDGMPFSNTGTVSQRMQDAVIKLIMLEQELNKIIDHYVDIKQEVIANLEKLPPDEYGVLHRYYIRYMTWEKVAEDLGCSSVHVWRIKIKGLNILKRLLQKE